MSSTDYLIIGLIIIGIAAYILYRYNRKVSKQMYEAQDMIAQHTQTMQVFVIDKKKARPKPELVGKQVYDQMTRLNRLNKMCMVKVKIGPKIMVLLCDQPVYDALETKKSYRLDMAGMYIVGITGARLDLKKKKSFKDKVYSMFTGRFRKDDAATGSKK